MNKRICTLALALLTLLSTALPALALGVDPQGPTDPQEVEAFADAFFVDSLPDTFCQARHLEGHRDVDMFIQEMIEHRGRSR